MERECSQYIIITEIPAMSAYCGTRDSLINDQVAQIEAKIPSGANMFTLNIALLSQSSPINLPEQNPVNGQTAKASNNIDMTISSHAKVFSI